MIILVSDQNGKQRISKTNALGQLADVWGVTAADEATEGITFPCIRKWRLAITVTHTMYWQFARGTSRAQTRTLSMIRFRACGGD